MLQMIYLAQNFGRVFFTLIMKKRRQLRTKGGIRVIHKKEERGKFLTAMIIATLIFHLNALYQVNHAGIFQETFTPIPRWLELSVLAGSIAGILIDIGLYFRQLWAVKILILTTIATLVFYIFFLNFGKLQETSFYLTIITSCLWYVAISRKWGYFQNE